MQIRLTAQFKTINQKLTTHFFNDRSTKVQCDGYKTFALVSWDRRPFVLSDNHSLTLVHRSLLWIVFVQYVARAYLTALCSNPDEAVPSLCTRKPKSHRTPPVVRSFYSHPEEAPPPSSGFKSWPCLR